MARRTATAMLALLALLSPPLAGIAAADRGIDPDDRDGDGRSDRQAEAQPLPCPTHQWNVPVEIEGLACILLLPKEAPADEESGSRDGRPDDRDRDR